MTLEDGRLLTNDAEEILDALMADAKDYFGPDLNDDDLATIRLFYAPFAQRLAETQTDLRLVLDSSQLDHAQGKALDLLTSLIGVQRHPATSATGTAVFSRDSRTHRSYTIQSGVTVQTDGSEPTAFETTTTRTLPLFDEFERANLGTDYVGDTADATVQSTTVLQGSSTLELAATAGSRVYNESVTTRQGMTLHYYTQCSTDTSPIFQFARQDDNNLYQVVIDHANDRVALEVIDGGTNTTVVEDTTAGIPADERLDVTIDWGLNGAFTITVTDSTDTEVTSLYETDTSFAEGHLAFKSGDANSTKYFDYVTTSETPVPVEAVETGPVGNVGRNSLVVMPDRPTGVEDVTNPQPTDGGTDEEGDTELRRRAQEELSDGSRASAAALVSAVQGIEGVNSVRLFEINTDGDDEKDGFELVIEGGTEPDIAQAILDTMAAGDTSHAGVNGTSASAAAELPNGQEMTVEFSRPDKLAISISADLTVEDTFAGTDPVRDSIVDYIGGIYTSGNDAAGLDAGEDVIYGDVEMAIRQVEGVYDVDNLTVDTSSTSGNTSNISVATTEVSVADGTDDSLTFTTTQR